MTKCGAEAAGDVNGRPDTTALLTRLDMWKRELGHKQSNDAAALLGEVMSSLSALSAEVERLEKAVLYWKVEAFGADVAAEAVAENTKLSAEVERLKGDSFQNRVKPWMDACFGPEISADRTEHNHRFIEEALELVQSTGCTKSEAHQLVEYVYGRDVGEPKQEVGGVMVTLAALCLAHGYDMHECGETELVRIWTKVEKIRAKQAAKPKHSPLPQDWQHPAESALSAMRAERDAMRPALKKLVTTALLLQQNAEGCAFNHHQHDFAEQGMPGWLVDTRADIEAARAALGGEHE